MRSSAVAVTKRSAEPETGEHARASQALKDKAPSVEDTKHTHIGGAAIEKLHLESVLADVIMGKTALHGR